MKRIATTMMVLFMVAADGAARQPVRNRRFAACSCSGFANDQRRAKRVPAVQQRICPILFRRGRDSAAVSRSRPLAHKRRESDLRAGARSAWHSHPLGQILIVTDGTGWIQQWGGPIEEIRKGDVIRIAPGVKQWHGATPTTALTHIAIQEELNGKAVEWMEKVTDEQYHK